MPKGLRVRIPPYPKNVVSVQSAVSRDLVTKYFDFMKFYVYILKSDVSSFYYVGSTQNISARLKLHNDGLVKSTKRYAPWKMVYNEEYPSLRDARKRELQIKSWKKRSAIERLINKAAMV